MSYIERTLAESEFVVARAKFHWSRYFPALLSLIPGGAVLAYAASYDPPSQAGVWFGSLAMAPGLGFLVWRWIEARSLEIGVTNFRLVVKEGIVDRRTREIGLHLIEELEVRQSPLGRLYNFGSLCIKTDPADVIVTPSIAAPVEFRRAIDHARYDRVEKPKPAETQSS